MTEELGKGIVRVLNVHGYVFQYSVLKTIESIYRTGRSPWGFEAAEFPVSLKNTPVHIDFILAHKEEYSYIIAECKRCDPSLSNWCFIKAPYVSRGPSRGERIVRELIIKAKGSPVIKTGLQWIVRSNEVYHLPFELRNRGKGEGQYGRGQINDSVTQVLRGLNGLIELAIESAKRGSMAFLKSDPRENLYATFMPVVFTTAKLWVSDCDISLGNIESGNIEIEESKLHEVKWLFYQYGQSPALKHSYSAVRENSDISQILYLDYTRTIPIVNASGIGEFLSDDLWHWPADWQSDIDIK